MKMIQGSGTISNYGNIIRNCTLGQLPYKIPVTSLSDVQLFIDVGNVKPTMVQYELIHTCGVNSGQVDAITPNEYVIGQDSDQRWYGVFKGFTGASPTCFVIAITLDSNIYFSDEYCIEDCLIPKSIEGCYGILDAALSRDCNGVYFGLHAGYETALGSTSVVYRHKVFLRGVEVTVASIKNTFKQGRTRTFRSEREKVYQLWAELIPEWYLSFVDAVFYRGEVNISGTRYLLNATEYEKVDECLKQWNPKSTFKESCYQSFSCEDDPCAEIPESCCDPIFISATVDNIGEESDVSSGVPEPPSTPLEIMIVEANVDTSVVVSPNSFTVSGITNGSTVVISDGLPGMRVFIIKGGLPLPGIDPGGGQPYYTKNLADNFITFSSGLVAGEYLYIETIP